MDMLNALHGLDTWFVILRGARPETTAERELARLGEQRGVPAAVAGHTYIGAPLIVNDEFYGALCGLDTRPNRHDCGDESPALTMAARLGGVTLPIGTARRERTGGLAAAVGRADAAMYERKAERGAKSTG